jgi:GTP pyrophosphokinase
LSLTKPNLVFSINNKVNGKIVSLKHLIQNGDTVEILKSHHQTPRREWLRYCRTSKAKSRIRAWLKRRQREKSIVVGRAIVGQSLKNYSRGSADANKREYHKKIDHVLSSLGLHDEKELLAAVGYGRISVESVMKAIFGPSPIQGRGDKRIKGDEFALQSIEHQGVPSNQLASRSSSTGLVVGNERNILMQFCRSCSPLYGEGILGVVSKGQGIKVHRQGCKHLDEADEKRVIKVDWDKNPASVAFKAVQLEVICEDSPGVLAQLVNAVSSANFNIAGINLRKVLSNGRGLARLEVMLRTADDLEKGELYLVTHLVVGYKAQIRPIELHLLPPSVMTRIKQAEGIISIQRV